jgi:hypothetical protein
MIDLRLPIGLFFLIVGGVLTTYGIFSPHDAPYIPERINADLDWGHLLVLFGGWMTLAGWIAQRRIKRNMWQQRRDSEDSTEVEM